MWRAVCCILGWLAVVALPSASAAGDPPAFRTLHVAVYDAAPYGARDEAGLFWGVSVDLWRQVAEDQHWPYSLTLVESMKDVIDGVASGRYDLAIGAITITPERLARVAFSYPPHRSGVAVATARQNGLWAILARYGTVAHHLGVLLALMLAFLLVTGVLVWLFERRAHKTQTTETSIGTVFEALYWVVVTMTTVGYGDKASRTHSGRAIAVVWMLGSLVMISLVTTSLVAQLTVNQLDDERPVTLHELADMRLTAAADSSGAEFLAASGLKFQPAPSLDAALAAVAAHRADAVINSVGALEWSVARDYSRTVELRAGLLAPALMGFAVTRGSPLLLPLDQVLVRVTTSANWVAREDALLSK
jgi:polar amino acid transport system substrate-binding protein